LLVYVDDILIVGKNISRIDILMKQLGESFSMKDMKVVKNIFDISILPDKKENKLWLSHEHYIKKVLHIF